MTEATGASAALLQRDAELELIDRGVGAAASGHGRLVLLEGPAGIGKTRLVDVARERAARAGLATLTARGGELEREFPYGVVRQLFEPLLVRAGEDERARLLAGAAALGGGVLGFADPAEGDGGPFARLHGLYWLTANLAADGPLLLAVDDAHWADPSSLRWLAYLARRLADLPVLVIVAARPAEPGEERDLLAALGAEPVASVAHPAPLETDAVDLLVRARLTGAPEPEFTGACHEATGGNPFLVGELLGALAADGVAPVAGEASRVRDLGPQAVARSVLLRLGRLPPPAPALARAVTILAEPAELRHAAALSDVDGAAAAEAADRLAHAAILQPGRPLEFVHPVVRAAVYAELAPAERSRAHARAARLLHAEGAPAPEVATHLLATEPAGDSWAIARLREAAAGALAGGAPEAAVTFLDRALREPPVPKERPELLLELGAAEARARGANAVDHLQEAFATAAEPRLRARAAFELGRALVLTAQIAAGVDVLRQGAEAVAGVDPELALRLEAELVGVARLDGPLRSVIAERLPSLRAQVTDGEGSQCLVLANAAWEDLAAGRPVAEVAPLAEQALAGGRMLAYGGSESPMFMLGAGVLLYCERFDAFDTAIAEADDDARRRGSALAHAFALLLRAYGGLRRGRLAEVEEDARSALGAMADNPFAVVLLLAAAYLADALMEQGRVDDAEQVLADAGFTGPIPPFSPFDVLLDVRGRVRLAQGDAEAALADLSECGERLRNSPNPAMIGWRGSAALAQLALGDRNAARALAETELELARAFGASRSIGIAQRAVGLVIGGEEGLRHVTAAVATLDGGPARLELARALIDQGALLRAAGRRREATDALRRGLDAAHACGAAPLVERARQELVAAGARPRRPALTGLDALTPSERRVAALAAAGQSNRDIAQALFVTTRTVELHLTHAYQKLGVRSRAELPDAFGEEGA